jgi:predicted ribosomally synthesized peptide with nif11-like leader
MSLESAKKFVQDVTENKELAAKFSKEMKGEWEDKLIADAKAEGYDFTAEELRDAILENQEIDVSELENVAGGYECRALGSGNECQAFAAGECKAFGSGNECQAFAAGECKAFGSGDQCKAIAAGDQCKAFAAGDCTCFGSNKNEGCTFFGDNCKFLAT